MFFISLPFALAALVLAGRVVPVTPRRARALDLGGQLLGRGRARAADRVTGGSGPVGLGLAGRAGRVSLSPHRAWPAFVMVEHRSSDPMLPLALFCQPSFRSGGSVGLLINLGLYGQLFVMSLYFQDIRGYSRPGDRNGPTARGRPAHRGLGPVGSDHGPVGTPRTYAHRTAGRWRRPAGDGVRRRRKPTTGLLVAPLAATGFGMALTMPAATASVMEAAPGGRGGIASGVVNAARQSGSVLGVALLGTLVAGRTTFITGLHVGLVIAAGAFFAGEVITFFGVDRRKEAPGPLDESMRSVAPGRSSNHAGQRGREWTTPRSAPKVGPQGRLPRSMVDHS